MKLTADEKREIAGKLIQLRRNPCFCQMKDYIQHGRISTYEHVRSVAIVSYQLDKTLHMHADKDTLLNGAFLHDFYLYDWHRKDHPHASLHGFYHPGVAAKNAVQIYGINEKTRDAIRSHMWPLTLTIFPKSREAVIICMADKIVALRETLFQR